MQPLTCPIPSNINPLQSNGFMFDILKLPEVKFFCQDVALPSLMLPDAEVPTPLSNIPIPGDKITFGSLQVEFLIDENMSNYKALHDWIVGLGFPKSHEQYANFLRTRTNSLNITPLVAGYSDAVLSILSSSNKPNKTIRFIDVFPTYLEQLSLSSTVTDITYLVAQATFKYTYYTFE